MNNFSTFHTLVNTIIFIFWSISGKGNTSSSKSKMCVKILRLNILWGLDCQITQKEKKEKRIKPILFAFSLTSKSQKWKQDICEIILKLIKEGIFQFRYFVTSIVYGLSSIYVCIHPDQNFKSKINFFQYMYYDRINPSLPTNQM